jgi:hypothetical protein
MYTKQANVYFSLRRSSPDRDKASSCRGVIRCEMSMDIGGSRSYVESFYQFVEVP